MAMAAPLAPAQEAKAPTKKLRPEPNPFIQATAEAVPAPSVGKFAETPALHDDFAPGWEETQTIWRIADWSQNKTKMSPERCRTNGEGMLVQTVLPELPGMGGSLESKGEFGYGRWVARVKPAAVAGLLNSIFTKDWDDRTTPDNMGDGDKGEVDIEFLSSTYGEKSGEVHLAIHLKGFPEYWAMDVPLDFNPSDEFREWGFDILPDRVVWHVDGKKLAEWRYDGDKRINPGYEFFFNSWTMEKWIKGPPKEKGEYLIDWVKFYPLEGV